MTRQWAMVTAASICLILAEFGVLAQDNPLVGEWVAVVRTQGGLGTARTFETNGTASTTFGAVLDFTYKLDGTTLVLLDDTGTPMPRKEVTLSGSQMILKDETSGQEERLTRMDGTKGSGITGKWTGNHYTGAKQIMHFTTNHNCYFSVPMWSTKEIYTVKGSTLTEECEGNVTIAYTWAIQDDILTLTEVGTNKVKRYKKKK